MNASREEELIKQIDALLLHKWDPIGVNGQVGASDEYTRYASKISQMLLAGKDAFSLAKYLRELESGMLSTPADEERIEEVVKSVVRAYNK